MSDLSQMSDRMMTFVGDLPRPQRAALYGAGIGAAVGIASGKSMLRYSVGFGLAGFALCVLIDSAAAVGFSRGIASREGAG